MIANLVNSIRDINRLLIYIIENDLTVIYPNTYDVNEILLTIPVSTASAEMSFPKLKLIKKSFAKYCG